MAGAFKVLQKKIAGLFPNKALRVICFGDSWTAGKNGYTGFSMLLGGYYATGSATNQGMPGCTSADGVANLTAKVLNNNPNICILNFGVNDWGSGAQHVTLTNFKANMGNMIQQMQTAGITVILWTSLMRSMTTANAEGNTFAEYMQAIRDLATQYNCKLFDFQQELQAFDYTSWWSDALHMNQTFHDYAWSKFKTYMIGKRKSLFFN